MQDIVTAPSALKRGHREDDILHALRNHVDSFQQDDGITMIVGGDHSGNLLEVGFLLAADDVIVHCMDARDKYPR